MWSLPLLGCVRFASVLMQMLLQIELVLVAFVSILDCVALLGLGRCYPRVLLTSDDILEIGSRHLILVISLDLSKLNWLGISISIVLYMSTFLFGQLL